MVSADRGRAVQATVWIVALVAVFLLWWLTRDARDLPDRLWRAYYASTVAANIAATGVILGFAWIVNDVRQWRLRTAQVLLACSATGLTLACIELPVLLFDYDYGIVFGTHTSDTWLQLATGINLADDELIYVRRPHSRYTGSVVGNLTWLGVPSRPPNSFDLRYDQHGFRNNQDLTRADVVAIGDSFVEGAEVAETETVSARMAAILGTPVANLGLGGYGPQQELAVLRRFGMPLAPRVVTWFVFGGNDLSDVETYEWRQQHMAEFLAPATVEARSFVRNALLALAARTTSARHSESPTAALHAVNFRTSAGTVERLYLDSAEEAWPPHGWDVLTRVLSQASDLARQGDARLLVVYVPRKLRVYSGFVEAPPGAYAHVWEMNNLPEVLGAWCRGHAIPYLDATIPLRAAVRSGRSVYLPDDVHWSAAGHAVAAEAVSTMIREWVLPEPATRARE
jgi:lysophospholipase L1-like esterase